MSGAAGVPREGGPQAGASFGDRLAVALAAHGRLCVGIDPHAALLRDWGLPDTAAGAREFGLRVVDAAAPAVGIVKPQVAFFERFGSAGYAVLEEVIRAARSAGLLVIADAKRGDIGTSVAAYAEAWLSSGSPLESDAMTVSAFQGVGSLEGPMTRAESSGKGLFVLAVTSNPEAAAIQSASATTGGERGTVASVRTVAGLIIDDVSAFNRRQPEHALGSIGLVLGATADLAAFGVGVDRLLGQNSAPILAPGFGVQGARIEDAARIYGAALSAVIVSESRSILESGPEEIGDAIARRSADVRRWT
jgi:orotidine-5'-phosphate decarboxylase